MSKAVDGVALIFFFQACLHVRSSSNGLTATAQTFGNSSIIPVPLPLELIKREPTTLKYTFHQLSSTSRIYEYKVVEERKLPIGTCDVAKLTCIATSLVSGTPYTVYLVACYRSGNETFCSEKSDPTTSYTSPFPPNRVRCNSKSAQSIAVTIYPLSESRHIHHYVAAIQNEEHRNCTSPATHFPACEIVGLRPSTRYTIAVRSWLDLALSDIPSDAKTCSVSTQSAPVSSISMTTTATTSSIKVTVMPLEDTTSSQEFHVSIQGSNAPAPCSLNPEKDPLVCEFTGLFSGTEYIITPCSVSGSVQFCSNEKVWTKPHEPANVTPSSITPSVMVVTFKAPNVATGIGLYEVSVVGGNQFKSCTILSTNKLECLLDDLLAATEYQVTARSCVDVVEPFVCSTNVTVSAWTRSYGACRLKI
uniref:Fibronectin type-III domain-containing protein n=1 Tax=Mesocestoides corti TaxID=53468 RepID=A0A5K3G2N2_MESCO